MQFYKQLKRAVMNKKIEINTNNDSKEVRIEMNRRGIDHLVMKLDRLRAKLSGEYNLSTDNNDVDMEFSSEESINEITFELKK